MDNYSGKLHSYIRFLLLLIILNASTNASQNSQSDTNQTSLQNTLTALQKDNELAISWRDSVPPGNMILIPNNLQVTVKKPQTAVATTTLLNVGQTSLLYALTPGRNKEYNTIMNENNVTTNIPYLSSPPSKYQSKTLISECAFINQEIFLNSTHLPAKKNIPLEFIIDSNSIGGNETLLIDFSITAEPSAIYSTIIFPIQTSSPPIFLENQDIEFIIQLRDMVNLPIYNSEKQSQINVEMVILSSTANIITCSTTWRTDEINNELLINVQCAPIQLQEKVYIINAYVDTIPIKNSNLSVSVKCREGLDALTDGSCVCGFGSYQASDGSCIPCPIGQYKDSLFENKCSKCSSLYTFSTTLKIGTVSVDDCVCEPGYWLISTHEDDVEKKCSICPDGVECSTYGVSQESAVLQKGYWRTSLNSSNVSPCESSTIACSGGNGTDLCAVGYEGPYCSLCADGYSYSVFLGGCKQCDDKANVAKNMIVAVSLMILLVTTLGWKFICQRSDINEKRNDSHEQLTTKIQKNKKTVDALIDDIGEFLTASSILWTKAKPVLVYLQYANVMSFSYRIQFPKFLDKFLAYFSFLNLNMSNLLQLDCFLPKKYLNFYASLVFLTMIPLISIIGIALYWLYLKYGSMNRMKDSFYKAKMDSFQRSLISFIVLLLDIIVAPAANAIFQISYCETLDDGVTLMQTDYSLTCEDKLYMFFFIYGIIMFGIYVLGIPLLFFIILYRVRKYLYKAGLSTNDNIQRRQSRYEKDLEPYYILFIVYKPECWWFDLIELVRRLAFSGGGVISFCTIYWEEILLFYHCCLLLFV